MELLGNCLHSLFAPTHPSTYLDLTSSSAATPHDSAKVTSDQQSRNSISCFHLALASVGSDTLVSCQHRPLLASTIPSYLPASLPFPLLACSLSQLHVGVSQNSEYLMTRKRSYHRTLDHSTVSGIHCFVHCNPTLFYCIMNTYIFKFSSILPVCVGLHGFNCFLH